MGYLTAQYFQKEVLMSIRLSDKHGVNPSITQCYYCGEDSGIALLGRMKGDKKAPMKIGVVDMRPCNKCEDYMKQGVILISVRNGEEGNDPYRTGGWVVVLDSLIIKMTTEEKASQILEDRWTFIPDEAWDFIGLPR